MLTAQQAKLIFCNKFGVLYHLEEIFKMVKYCSESGKLDGLYEYRVSTTQEIRKELIDKLESLGYKIFYINPVSFKISWY